MNIAEYAKRRHTAKAFDRSRSIPNETIEVLQTVLRHSPSSVNSQPWHFIFANSDESKERIAKATQSGFAYNEDKIRNASHVVVFCARTDMDADHLDAVLNQEQSDGRFATSQGREGQSNSRNHYVNLHRFDQKDLQHWMEKQVYLALGTLLISAETQGVNACPMEGFDPRVLDAELGLNAQSLTSVVIVALGYSGSEDFNAKLPKSRLPSVSVFSDI
jgi:nitroreductase/dihydropteridine reductase